ncbi:MAG TPA: hypothetical protein VL947_07650, partial [Cytophagales bacterium]|nr:hypothetical protein [Cytophagales bacterium]
METLEITRQVQAKRYFLLKADYYVQLMMMWIIFGLSVTLIGIFISMLLMIPWGAIQIVSAAYNTYQRWDEVHYRKRYLGYWTLVLIIAALFYVRDHCDHLELN